MKNITIKDAIIETLDAFGNLEFTIFDITRSIRDDVNSGQYTLPTGKNVRHFVVRETFQNMIDDRDAIFNDYIVAIDSNRGCRTFKKVDPSTIPSTIPSISSQPLPARPAANLNVRPSIIPVDIQRRMYYYIQGKNSPVTIKQIQSALKRYTYTCQELYDFLLAVNFIDPQFDSLPVSKRKTR